MRTHGDMRPHAWPYVRLCLSTGRCWNQITQPVTRLAFLELLNDWNRIGAGKFQYWSAS
jgi:hypothetical protein